jgi:predicted dehydrogenase
VRDGTDRRRRDVSVRAAHFSSRPIPGDGWKEQRTVADVLRVGLVGAGPWAGMFTAPMLAAGPATALAAVWARRAEASGDLAARYGVPAVGSLSDLFAECDAVAFAVPPNVQAEIAVQAAEAGKHLLL